MRIPENLCMLLPKALKMRAIKQTMALITDSIGRTKCAPAQMPWHLRHRNPALLNRQGMSTHSKMENGSELCHWKGQLVIGLRARAHVQSLAFNCTVARAQLFHAKWCHAIVGVTYGTHCTSICCSLFPASPLHRGPDMKPDSSSQQEEEFHYVHTASKGLIKIKMHPHYHSHRQINRGCKLQLTFILTRHD